MSSIRAFGATRASRAPVVKCKALFSMLKPKTDADAGFYGFSAKVIASSMRSIDNETSGVAMAHALRPCSALAPHAPFA